MTSDLLGLSSHQLQHLLEEHQAHRPADLFSPEMTGWMERKDRLKFHLDLAAAAEAQAWKPADGPARPIAPAKPEESLDGPGFSPRRPTKSQLEETCNPKSEPVAPAAQETHMTTPKSGPEERLGQLMTRLAGNRKNGTPEAASLTRGAIRRHCEAHGLPIPKEAQIRRDCAPKKFRKPAAKTRATAPQASASPRQQAAQGSETPRARGGNPFSGAIAAADLIGMIRSWALGLLPDLQSLSPEEARAAHDEMDLLAQVLVLGGKLIARQVA